MDYYAGIDASLETANICIVDSAGVAALADMDPAR